MLSLYFCSAFSKSKETALWLEDMLLNAVVKYPLQIDMTSVCCDAECLRRGLTMRSVPSCCCELSDQSEHLKASLIFPDAAFNSDMKSARKDSNKSQPDTSAGC